MNDKARLCDILEEVEKTGKVTIRGVGRFEIVKRKPKNVYDLTTGGRTLIPQGETIKFKPAKVLLDRLRAEPS